MAKQRTTEKPATEKKLFLLQEKYFNPAERAQVEQEFFQLLVNYTQSLLLRSLKSYSLHYPTEEVYNKTIDIVLEVFRQFDRGEKMQLSFAGVLNLKILEVLFAKKVKRLEQIYSLDKEIPLKNGIKTLIDVCTLEHSAFGTPLIYQDPYYLVDTSESAIQTVLSVLDTAMAPDVMLPIPDRIWILGAIYHTFFHKKNLDAYKAIFIKSNVVLHQVLDTILYEIYNALADAPSDNVGVENGTDKKSGTPRQLLNFSRREAYKNE